MIGSLLEDFSKCKQNRDNLQVFRDRIKEGKEVPEDEMNAALLTSLKHLNDLNTRLVLLLVVYTSGGDFKTDSAKVLTKLGLGQEALQELMRQKMNAGL